MCIILTFVANQGNNRLDVRLFIGLLHHTEPVLQILKALVVGDVINQENALFEIKTKRTMKVITI